MKLIHIVGPAMLFTNTFLVLTEAGHAIAIDAFIAYDRREVSSRVDA